MKVSSSIISINSVVESCFSKDEFNEALQNSTEQLKLMESILESGYDIPGFLQTPSDAGFKHFSTHNIEKEAMSDNFIANAANSALMTMQKRYNLSKKQLRICIDRENITIDLICEVRKPTCEPSKTK